MSEAAAPSAGALLRQAREQAGLHVAALAVALKVPVKKLEALEGDRYDQLPDAVFARALASSVCRTLKIDPQPVLDRLPQSAAPRLVQSGAGINAPFQVPGDVVAPAWRGQLLRPVPMAVGALLLGALVIVFMPSLRVEQPAQPKLAETTSVPMAAAVVVEPAVETAAPAAAPGAATPTAIVETPTAAPQPQAAASTAPAAAPRPAASAAAVTPRPAASVATVAAPAAAAAAASAAQPPVATTGTIVFRTTGPSWVQVTDGKGTVALQRLMAAGETAGASGAPPLAVTVGDVKATTVSVRGKPYDLGPVSRDNVARFEVK